MLVAFAMLTVQLDYRARVGREVTFHQSAARRRIEKVLAGDAPLSGLNFLTAATSTSPADRTVVVPAPRRRCPMRLDLIVGPDGAGRTTIAELALSRTAVAAPFVDASGHPVPEEKIRHRYERLWPFVRIAITQRHSDGHRAG